ncbi:hypothetical protein K443DRAFT_672513 [Laccaria amethystina LaAM-08-1]|uniref:Uncharacterized protein n=1 Tax=Laccaria amethystina LaAM-08-1 TaxID=1095629 RepID=A0A0C9XU87_9AGAR|nr:hypothetical protein K443DRAFT_672513 [Laccaria amethystina LaAM-08-1]
MHMNSEILLARLLQTHFGLFFGHRTQRLQVLIRIMGKPSPVPSWFLREVQLPPSVKLHKVHIVLFTTPLFEIIDPLCLIKAFTWN